MDRTKYISQLQFPFGGFSTKTFEMLDDMILKQLQLFENIILIHWVKAKMLSGQKAVFRHTAFFRSKLFLAAVMSPLFMFSVFSSSLSN